MTTIVPFNINLIDQIDQIDQTNNTNTFECSICVEDVDLQNILFLDECSHFFCRVCVSEYCKTMINYGTTMIKCPDKNCTSFISHAEILDIFSEIIDGPTREKYEKFLLNNVLEQFDDVIWCPLSGCTIPIILDDSYNNTVLCNQCNKRFCILCKEVDHSGYTCEQYKKYGSKLGTFETWLEIKQDSVKKCPNCNYYIEKTEGCNIMTCCKCKKKFCWLCSHEFQSDTIITQHYAVKKLCINTYVEEVTDKQNVVHNYDTSDSDIYDSDISDYDSDSDSSN